MGYGPGPMHNLPAGFDPRSAPGGPLAAPFGYPTAFDSGMQGGPQHHFGPALGQPLPPSQAARLDFQGRDMGGPNPSRPPSNPRPTVFGKDPSASGGSGGGHNRTLSNQAMRAYPGHFPPTYSDHDVWPKQPLHAAGHYQLDDGRRGPSGGPAEIGRAHV